MNFLPAELAHCFRISSYQEKIQWIVGTVVFFLFLPDASKEIWLLLNNTFVLLEWEVLYENIFLKC